MPEATAPYSAEIIPIRPRNVALAPPIALQSVEMALSLAILSALSIGSKRDRKLFQLVGWELGRMANASPDSAMLAEANDIYSRVREVNYGR